MNGLTATVDTYLAAWNARDPARRAELIAEVWSEEGQLIDPPLAAEGRQAISEMAEAMHQHYVDHHFTASAMSTATTAACASLGNWSVPTGR